MPEDERGRQTKSTMENDFLTAGNLALMEQYKNHGGCYEYGRCGSHGMATTGIGLAAGLGGGALLLAIAGIWGVNQASKARANGNSKALETLANLAISEHNSRESWQLKHTPTLAQYVDVRAGAGANAFSSAFANAESQIVSDALTGRSQICPQAVSLYSAPQPCPCPASNPCGCNL